MAGPLDFSQDGAFDASGAPTPAGGSSSPAADPSQVQWGGWNTGDPNSMKSMYSSLGENSGKWTKDPTTGTVYDGVDAQGPGNQPGMMTGSSGENSSNLAGLNDATKAQNPGITADQLSQYDTTMGWGTTPAQAAPGQVGMPLNYAEGGLVTDGDGDTPGGDSNDSNDSTGGSQWQSMVNDAISKVNSALSYGYQLHGLSGGASSGLPTGQQDTQAGSAGSGSPRYQDFNKSPNVEDRRNNPPMNPVSQATNNFEGKAYSLAQRALPLDDQSDNPLSQQAGINDVDNTQKGGIPDEEN